ncbi:MAG: hypothetical protein AAFW00_16080 [Bacteroidota bacterium]
MKWPNPRLLFWLLIHLGCLTCGANIWAQGTGLYTGLVPCSDTLRLPLPGMVPFSEQIKKGDQVLSPSEDYQINYARGWIILPCKGVDSLELSYRYFLSPSQDTVALRQFQIVLDTVTREDIGPDVFILPKDPEKSVFWPESDNIRKSGSLSRGLTLGNGNNLGISSGLRLQLEGDLGDGLKIVGAITDENIPIQPEGNTQQISDFDKIFIKLSKDAFAVTLGDYEVTQKGSRFANYYRNVQGIQAQYQKDKTKVSVSGAIAKGRFFTNSFMGVDGLAGPYQLRGRNNEQFFIILAGSERVYLNGRVMKRGENEDYVINYNTAQITFTAKHVITNITRIVVDFEYTEQTFSRSLLTAQVSQKLWDDKLSLHFSVARDADNPSAPFDTTGFLNDQKAIQAAGDTNFILLPGARRLGPDNPLSRYELRDTLVNGQFFPYYRFTTSETLAEYQVSFLNVGVGNGQYRREANISGGDVYTWIGPDSLGQLQGNYEPLRRRVAPRELIVSNFQLRYQLTDRLTFYSETAISDRDQNRLSDIGDEDNQDYGQLTGIRGKDLRLGDSVSLSFDLHHQYIGKNFQNLDRVYQAEYYRKWDLNPDLPRINEQVVGSSIGFDYKKKLNWESQIGWRGDPAGLQILRQEHTLRSFMSKGLRGSLTYTDINRQSEGLQQASWRRLEGNMYIPWRGWSLGSEVWLERKTDIRGDSTLIPSNFQFWDVKPYLRYKAGKGTELDISFNYRFDREQVNGILLDKSKAYTGYVKARVKPLPSWNIRTILSLRQLDVLDSVFAARGLENSRLVNVNLQTNYAPKNRLVFANLLYEVNAEQVARREIRFIQVNPGQGTHVWLDSLFNNDGIPDLQEFQIATNPLIADYIQALVPTRELVPATKLSLSGLVRWDLRKIISSKRKGFLALARQTRLTSNLRITQYRSQGNDFASYLIDIGDPFADTSLINASYNQRHELSFFQNAPGGDVRFFYSENQSKLFLLTGDEFRGRNFYGIRTRLNISRRAKSNQSLEIEYKRGNRFTQVPVNEERNFDILFDELTPTYSWQFNRKFRLSGAYAYSQRVNQQGGLVEMQRVREHKISFENKWNITGRNTLTSRLELIQVIQTGSPNPTVGYELRQGLQAGRNGIWQVFLTWFILKNVELNFIYDGRVSQQIPVLHSGKIQARAFF